MSSNASYLTFEQWEEEFDWASYEGPLTHAAWDAGLALGLAEGEREAKRLMAALDSAVTFNMSKNRIIERLQEAHDEAVRRLNDGDWMQALIVLKDVV